MLKCPQYEFWLPENLFFGELRMILTPAGEGGTAYRTKQNEREVIV